MRLTCTLVLSKLHHLFLRSKSTVLSCRLNCMRQVYCLAITSRTVPVAKQDVCLTNKGATPL